MEWQEIVADAWKTQTKMWQTSSTVWRIWTLATSGFYSDFPGCSGGKIVLSVKLLLNSDLVLTLGCGEGKCSVDCKVPLQGVWDS